MAITVLERDGGPPGLDSAVPLARFLLLCLGVWLHSADTLVTATIAPAVIEDIGGVAYVNWTISLYEVGAIIAGTAAPMLCRHWGIKGMLIAAALLYGAGCVLGALAPAMGVLVAGRFVQGMGGGMMLSLCYVAIEAWYPPTRWNFLFGIVALIWGVGSLLGPLVGAAFAGPHTWRGAFWAFAGQAAILVLIAQIAMPASPRAATPAGQWPVRALLLLCAATLIIAEAGATGGALPATLGALLGLGLLYAAARVDRRAAVRLLPAQLLDLRHPVGAGLAMVFALSVGTTGFWAYGPLLLKILFGTQPLVTGYILAGEAIVWSIATAAASRATPAAGARLIRGGTVAVVLGAAGFAVVVPAGSLVGMVVCGLLQGAGFGLCWSAIVHRTVRHSAPQEQSLASASVSTVQRIGYAVGTAAVGIAANLSGLADGVSAAAARTAGFWVFAAFIPILLLGLGSAWRFTRAAAA
jgi:MFS family permease